MCDTGPLVAAVARTDRHHQVCRALIEHHRRAALVAPVTVAVEVDQLGRPLVLWWWGGAEHVARARLVEAHRRVDLADRLQQAHDAEPGDVAGVHRLVDARTWDCAARLYTSSSRSPSIRRIK